MYPYTLVLLAFILGAMQGGFLAGCLVAYFETGPFVSVLLFVGCLAAGLFMGFVEVAKFIKLRERWRFRKHP